MRERLVDPWLVAVWPGMGSVALNAGRHLIEGLGARRIMNMPVDDYFEVDKVEVKDGVVRLGRLPRCTFHSWKNPLGGRDLLIFFAESQPTSNSYELSEAVLDVGIRLGATRVVTFAAMATQIHPTARPRVLGVANEATLKADLELERVGILEDGQVSGLNGVMLAAAARKELEGIALLGEIPFFAASLPNPKTSIAVLEVFQHLAGFRVDLSSLENQAGQFEERLVELVDRMTFLGDENESDALSACGGAEFLTPDETGFLTPQDDAQAAEGEGARAFEERLLEGRDFEDEARIESMFEAAEGDRSKAFELKDELDRLGAFNEYEDRFLDLFKRR